MVMLGKVQWWYWLIAIVVTLYHAYRGYRYYRLGAKQQQYESWSKQDKVTILYIQGAFLFMICSVVGFLGLLAAYHLWIFQEAKNSIDTGSALLIAFWFLLGILGVSGELPNLVQQGKLPSVG